MRSHVTRMHYTLTANGRQHTGTAKTYGPVEYRETFVALAQHHRVDPDDAGLTLIPKRWWQR